MVVSTCETKTFSQAEWEGLTALLQVMSGVQCYYFVAVDCHVLDGTNCSLVCSWLGILSATLCPLVSHIITLLLRFLCSWQCWMFVATLKYTSPLTQAFLHFPTPFSTAATRTSSCNFFLWWMTPAVYLWLVTCSITHLNSLSSGWKCIPPLLCMSPYVVMK
jgi:hypothetical protein